MNASVHLLCPAIGYRGVSAQCSSAGTTSDIFKAPIDTPPAGSNKETSLVLIHSEIFICW